jgi:hypothetical protein
VLAGLCERCVHRRMVRSNRGATFLLCGLSRTDPRFARYPRLPVILCDGFRAGEPEDEAGTEPEEP